MSKTWFRSLCILLLCASAALPAPAWAGGRRDGEDRGPRKGQVSVVAFTGKPGLEGHDAGSEVIVTALPGGATLGKVSVHVYDAGGRLVRVLHRDGHERPVLRFTGETLVRGDRLAVDAAVFDPSTSEHPARARAEATVLYRPHLTLTSGAAPTALTTGQPGRFSFTLGEAAGDLGTSARLTLADGRAVVASLEASVPPGGSVVVSLSASFAAPGPHALTATLVPLPPTTPGHRDDDELPRAQLRSTLRVVPPPSIEAFTVAPAEPIELGARATLLPIFAGGEGLVVPGALPAFTGVSLSVQPTATTPYTLVVTNEAGTSVSATATVQVATASATVDTSGGFVRAPGGLALELPFGALDGPVALQASATTLPPPAGLAALSPVYQFEPEGLLFSRPVKVTLPLPPGVTEASVYWSRLGSPGFDAIGGTIDLVAHTISAETPHFSQAVVGPSVTTRTVTGVGQVTWISASSRKSVPIDFALESVEALVSDGAGGLRSLPGVAGVGAAAGTFTIAEVPVGRYVLHSGQQFLVTESSSPDLGWATGGRPDALPLDQSAVIDLTIDNLAPWQDGDWLEFYSSEANDWDFYLESQGTVTPLPGATTLSFPYDLKGIAMSDIRHIQGSLGDRACFAQLSAATTAAGLPYTHMTRLAALPPFDVVEGGSVTVNATAVDVSQDRTASFDYRGTQWDALLAEGNPAAALQPGYSFLALLGQPGRAEDGFYSSNTDPLTLMDPAGDLVTGPVTFGFPAGTVLPGDWGLLFDVRKAAPVTYKLPGTTNGFQVSNRVEWVTSLEAAQGGPIVPPVGMPLSIAVAGQPFFAGGAGIGTTPVLSWAPPRVGSPAVYGVDVFRLFTLAGTPHRTRREMVASVVTPDTSFAFPAGILEAGQSYLFTVGATVATSQASATLLSNAPFKAGLDIAYAVTSSGIFTP